ncbi:unnamed protein product [Linum tenue]|uniref:EF-hand domain-containing protein n=1 Tax=Linum tenue TaxID=586396 RepID=A0AAV0S7Y2_9ROSI|nr:unnamed protein product [Linum tenue]
MIAAALLLLLLFLAGIFNLNSYFPSKKLRAWLHSLFLQQQSEPATPPPAASVVDRSNKDADEDLTSVFATFDKNGDGFITKQELKESLKNIRISVTEAEVEEMVAKVDSNGDGLIDFEEFKILCRNMAAGGEGEEIKIDSGGDELRDAFEVFDRDRDGLITVEELGSVLSSLGMKEGKRMEACKEMIRRVDADGDGMVNFDEFRTMMRNGGGKLLPVF